MKIASSFPVEPWSWSSLPTDRVVHLSGAAGEALLLALDPLPSDAPAVVSYTVTESLTPQDLVGAILNEFESAALKLFPLWLPGGDHLEGTDRLSVLAAHALAKSLASGSDHFGPFVSELSEAAIAGRHTHRSGFASEIRAAGLARVLAASYGRKHLALVIAVSLGPDDAVLPVTGQHALAAACEWLSGFGGFGIWLVDAPIPDIDRFSTYSVQLPEDVQDVLEQVEKDSTRSGRRRRPVSPPFWYPPRAGHPASGSPSEIDLEEALATRSWSVGREWNKTHQPNFLRAPIRVDLMWEAEKCVVEVDGDDHRSVFKYAQDRQRDNALALDGYVVLRFTNDRIADDMSAVVSSIETLIRRRRRALADNFEPQIGRIQP